MGSTHLNSYIVTHRSRTTHCDWLRVRPAIRTKSSWNPGVHGSKTFHLSAFHVSIACLVTCLSSGTKLFHCKYNLPEIVAKIYVASMFSIIIIIVIIIIFFILFVIILYVI